MILSTIVVFGLMALSDFSPVVKNKQKKELIVLIILYLFVFTLAILLALGVRPPSAANWFHELIQMLPIRYPQK